MDSQKTQDKYKEIIKLALAEDLEPRGDMTSKLMVPIDASCAGEIVAREAGVLAGVEAARLTLELTLEILDRPANDAEIKFLIKEGAAFHKGDTLATFSGNARVLLAAERTLLNFLQRLSGIATKTRSLVDLIHGYPVRLLDTRKTSPCLRPFEKAAFLVGGGTAHRYNLSDMILIKENHQRFGGVTPELIKSARASETRIECEVHSEEEIERVVLSGVDVIMLDNFSPVEVRNAVQKVYEVSAQISENHKVELEASGGINERNIVEYAATGVDYISTSKPYTESRSIDLSMLLH